MTNEEKYKTAEERHVNWRKFCTGRDFCKKCELREEKPACSCIFKWLELEAEEELLPCPFCGSGATLHSSCESWVECNICGARTKMCACDSGAIKQWNRREP